jgi:hypothetical protein
MGRTLLMTLSCAVRGGPGDASASAVREPEGMPRVWPSKLAAQVDTHRGGAAATRAYNGREWNGAARSPVGDKDQISQEHAMRLRVTDKRHMKKGSPEAPSSSTAERAQRFSIGT